ncbi:hypothetical protein LZ31DRAFT_102677 [Colletotrichum somersetense]|nr:hypothetical protein LZ31DRAFT_102677 [Colletotrichum somersetense]
MFMLFSQPRAGHPVLVRAADMAPTRFSFGRSCRQSVPRIMHAHQAMRTVATPNVVFAGSVSRHRLCLPEAALLSLTRTFARELSPSRMGRLLLVQCRRPLTQLGRWTPTVFLQTCRIAAPRHRPAPVESWRVGAAVMIKQSTESVSVRSIIGGHLLVSARVRGRAPYFKARRSCNPTCLRRRLLLSEQD